MTKLARIDRCLARPIIPVVSELSANLGQLASASSIILQGAKIVELPRIVEAFGQPPLKNVRLLVHLDLITGLENNDSGLEYLVQFAQVEGVVTVHHHLMAAAKRLGLLSILRIFLSDSRALERGLKVIASSRPDVVDILPAAAATHVSDEFRSCQVPHIAGGLCRTEDDVREALAAGCRAVTSTRPTLWRLNG